MGAQMSAAIELKNVSRHFDDTEAVSQVSFTLETGQLLVLLGASGCGKTTTLRLIAGLETPDAGEVWLNGRRVAGGGSWVPPEARHIGMVFQDYALFPHLTAAENIAFPLNKLPRAERGQRVEEMLEHVGLAGKGERYPHQLSGGEQQRVALARALASKPEILLLDEPFSNLDAALRREMREEVGNILREVGATAVFVTHDQEEALSLADQIAIMRGGRLVQVAPPQDVYLRPATRDIALFLGEANFVPGQAEGEMVRCALGQLRLAQPVRGPVEVMIRPEALSLHPDPQGNARVKQVRFFGHDQLVSLALNDGSSLQARTWPRPDIRPGQCVRMVVEGGVMGYQPA